jgi:H+-transporting ATPase
LGTEEVNARLRVYGYNEIPERKEKLWARLGKRFWGIVPWMLEITAVVTFVLGEYVQASITLFLLFFNAGISLWRESRAKTAMAAPKRRLSVESRVKRAGKWLTISARELVPGDLMHFCRI